MEQISLRVFSIFTQHVQLKSSNKSPLFNHHLFHLWSLLPVFNLGILTTMLDKGCKRAKKWCWIGLYGPNPLY
jgi:hypothetical protein